MASQESSGSEPLFRVAVTRSGAEAVVGLTGELDLASAPHLRDCLATLAEEGVTQIVLDLTDLDFVDSTGLSVLVMDFQRTRAEGGWTRIRNPTPSVTRVLEITGLASVFSIGADGEFAAPPVSRATT
jgi:anti-sigma B factor antagonist